MIKLVCNWTWKTKVTKSSTSTKTTRTMTESFSLPRRNIVSSNSPTCSISLINLLKIKTYFMISKTLTLILLARAFKKSYSTKKIRFMTAKTSIWEKSSNLQSIMLWNTNFIQILKKKYSFHQFLMKVCFLLSLFIFSFWSKINQIEIVW